MKRLLIHVGHGKTGSSYLQSVFALNRKFLNSNGIYYPVHASLEKAKAGGVSSGNGELVHNEYLPIPGNSNSTVFLSSELLFRSLLVDQKLKDLSRNYEVEVVIYTRNVVEHSVSKWAQAVKRGGVYIDVDTFLTSTPNDVLTTLIKWIDKSKQIGFDLSIRNYSFCKDRLAEDFFEHFLNIDVSTYQLKLPENKVVNRSLTNSEYEIQRLFNAAFGRESSSYISKFVVEKFPEQGSLKIKINNKTFDYIEKENGSMVREINKTLTEEQKLEIGLRDEWVASFPMETMENNVLQELSKSVANSMRFLSDDEIDCIKDLSIKFAETHNDLASALMLMKVAQRHRPNEPFIIPKLQNERVELGNPRQKNLRKEEKRKQGIFAVKQRALVARVSARLPRCFTQRVKAFLRRR